MVSDDQLSDFATPVAFSDQLARSVRVFARRWRTVVVLVVLAVVVSAIVSESSARSYTATAKVTIDPVNEVEVLVDPGSNVSSADPEADLNTAVAEITETPVADLVKRSLRTSESTQSLIEQVSTSLEGTTEIVDIDARDPSSARAAQLANAFATQYVQFSLANVLGEIQGAISTAQSQLARLTPAQRGGAIGTQLQQRIITLQADAAVATPDAQVTQSATSPTSPSSPKPSRDALIAAIVGLLVAVVAVILLELLDRRVRDEDEVSGCSQLPTLGVIPARRRARSNWEEEEGYTAIAVDLISRNLPPDANLVLVASPGAQDGRTSVALGLGAALASLGQRVTAVECDMRRPSFARLLGLSERGPSLSRALADPSGPIGLIDVPSPASQAESAAGRPKGAATTRRLNGRRTHSGLRVLPAGPRPAHPQALLASAEMQEVLRELRAGADIVLIDSPAFTLIKDAEILATRADHVLVVARIRHTARDALSSTTRATLEHAASSPLGVVVLGGRDGATGRYAPGRTRAPVGIVDALESIGSRVGVTLLGAGLRAIATMRALFGGARSRTGRARARDASRRSVRTRVNDRSADRRELRPETGVAADPDADAEAAASSEEAADAAGGDGESADRQPAEPADEQPAEPVDLQAGEPVDEPVGEQPVEPVDEQHGEPVGEQQR